MLASPHQFPYRNQQFGIDHPSSLGSSSFYDTHVSQFDAVPNANDNWKPYFSERTLASTAQLMHVPSLVSHSIDPVPITTTSRFSALEPLFSGSVATDATAERTQIQGAGPRLPQQFSQRQPYYRQPHEPFQPHRQHEHHQLQRPNRQHYQQQQNFLDDAPGRYQQYQQYLQHERCNDATKTHSLRHIDTRIYPNVSHAGQHNHLVVSPVGYRYSHSHSPDNFTRPHVNMSPMHCCGTGKESPTREYESTAQIKTSRWIPQQAWPTVEQYCRTCQSCPCDCRSKRVSIAPTSHAQSHQKHGQYATTSAAMSPLRQHALASSPLSASQMAYSSRWSVIENEQPAALPTCRNEESPIHKQHHQTGQALPRGRPNANESVASLLQPDSDQLVDHNSDGRLSRRKNLTAVAAAHEATVARMDEEADYLRAHRQFARRGLCESNPVLGVKAKTTPGGMIWRYESMMPPGAPKCDHWHQLPHSIQDYITAYGALPERQSRLADKLHAEALGLQAEFEQMKRTWQK